MDVGGFELGDCYGDYVGVCGVRRSEECEGPVCFVGSLCGSLWIPATDLVDRPDSGCGEFQGGVGYVDYASVNGVRRSEEFQRPGYLVPVMNLVSRPDSGCGGFEVGDWYGDNINVCRVRRSEECEGPECLVGNCNK